MAFISFALSLHNFINKVGADAGFASIIGLALLILLYFAQVRESSDAARARRRGEGARPQRAARLPRRSTQAAAAAQPTVAPRPAGRRPSDGKRDRRRRHGPRRGGRSPARRGAGGDTSRPPPSFRPPLPRARGSGAQAATKLIPTTGPSPARRRRSAAPAAVAGGIGCRSRRRCSPGAAGGAAAAGHRQAANASPGPVRRPASQPDEPPAVDAVRPDEASSPATAISGTPPRRRPPGAPRRVRTAGARGARGRTAPPGAAGRAAVAGRADRPSHGLAAIVRRHRLLISTAAARQGDHERRSRHDARRRPAARTARKLHKADARSTRDRDRRGPQRHQVNGLANDASALAGEGYKPGRPSTAATRRRRRPRRLPAGDQALTRPTSPRR